MKISIPSPYIFLFHDFLTIFVFFAYKLHYQIFYWDYIIFTLHYQVLKLELYYIYNTIVQADIYMMLSHYTRIKIFSMFLQFCFKIF